RRMPDQFAKQIYFGRGNDNDIVISNPRVSERHLVLQVENPQKIFVKDLGSTNGTYVNGHLLGNQAVQIRPGDQLKAADQDIDWLALLNYSDEPAVYTAEEEKEKGFRDEHPQKKSASGSKVIFSLGLGLGFLILILLIYWYLNFIVLP
ncbi:MAG: FHA domain-containing protein, partial [Bacteroidota bacterium]